MLAVRVSLLVGAAAALHARAPASAVAARPGRWTASLRGARTTTILMEDEKGFDLNAAFAARLKETTGTDAPKQAKRRADAQQAAEAKRKGPKNRRGPNLDLANKPQNFFRGLAERDERFKDTQARRRDEGLGELEEADLLDAEDAQIFLAGFALFAVLLAVGPVSSYFEQQGYQEACHQPRPSAPTGSPRVTTGLEPPRPQAVDSGNLALQKCLDYAYSFSEKNICKIKYSN